MTEPTPYAAPLPPAAKWNVLSIISIATSVVGISLAGIITGHIALSQIKRTGEQGRVLAIIGLVVGYLGIVVGLILGIIYIGLFLTFGAASLTN